MLELKNINVIVQVERALEYVAPVLRIAIEVFGLLEDEEKLGDPQVIDLIGNALVDALDDANIKQSFGYAELEEEWTVPLVEAGEQLETDGLPWEFCCKRGAQGRGRWTVEYELELLAKSTV